MAVLEILSSFLLVSSGLVAGFLVASLVLWRLRRRLKSAPASSFAQQARSLLAAKSLDANEDKSSSIHFGQLKRSPGLQKKIDELLDKIIRLYVEYWYNWLTFNEPSLSPKIKQQLDVLVDRLHSRVQQIDWVSFLTQDVVHLFTHYVEHLSELDIGLFPSHPCLQSDADEERFLRHAAESAIRILLPVEASCDITRLLLREVIGISVLKTTIDYLTDPDFINQQIIWHLTTSKTRNVLSEKSRESFSYSNTYTGFVRLINSCKDLDELNEVKYNIIVELFQIKQVQELKTLLKEGKMDKKTLSAITDTAKVSRLLKSHSLQRYERQV